MKQLSCEKLSNLLSEIEIHMDFQLALSENCKIKVFSSTCYYNFHYCPRILRKSFLKRVFWTAHNNTQNMDTGLFTTRGIATNYDIHVPESTKILISCAAISMSAFCTWHFSRCTAQCRRTVTRFQRVLLCTAHIRT
jgi:hypothetical protein